MQNVVKHGSASEVIIQLSELDNVINIAIEDNGNGSNSDLWENSTGVGFANLRNRVNYLKGTIHVNTKPGEGRSFLIEFNRPS